jgi:hypothetical protein
LPTRPQLRLRLLHPLLLQLSLPVLFLLHLLMCYSVPYNLLSSDLLLPPVLLRNFIALTPWSRVLLQKPPVAQLLKNFLTFYGTRRFITVFTRLRHWSLSWARWIQSIPHHPISLRYISILPSHLRPGLPSGLFPSGFPTQNTKCIILRPMHATYLVYYIFLDLMILNIFGGEYKLLSSSLCNFLHPSLISSLVGANILLNTLFSKTPSILTLFCCYLFSFSPWLPSLPPYSYSGSLRLVSRLGNRLFQIMFNYLPTTPDIFFEGTLNWTAIAYSLVSTRPP